MPSEIQHIRELVRFDKLEEALDCLYQMDEDMAILIQQQWKTMERVSIKGTGRPENEVRTEIANLIMRCLASWKPPLAALRRGQEDGAPAMDEESTEFLKNVDHQLDMRNKDLLPEHQDRKSRRVTYFYFAEKFLALSELQETLQEIREKGEERDTLLLKTLREVLMLLADLREILDTEELRQAKLTLYVKDGQRECKAWRSALLNGNQTKQELSESKAEILLFRISQELEAKKDTAEQYS